MSGGPYPQQVGDVGRYGTPAGTACDVVTCQPGDSPLLAYIPDRAVNGSPMCWVLHGVGSDYVEIITTAPFGTTGCTDALLDAGYIVVSPSTAPPPTSQNSWGNQAGRYQHVRVWEWAQSVWPNVPGPYLYGISHGCMVGLNVLMERFPVSAFMANSGVCSLVYGYQHINAADIRTAYGLGSGEGPGTAGWDTKTAGHDPMVVPMGAFPQIPMRFVASYADNTAVQEENTDAFRARLTAANWPAENSLYEFLLGHVDSTSFRKDDILAFFARSAPYTPLTAGRIYTKQVGIASVVEAQLSLLDASGDLVPVTYAQSTKPSIFTG